MSKKPAHVGTDGLDPTRWRTLFVVAISQLMIVLDSSIMNIAIPSAKIDLGISDANQQWVITAYTLAFGSLLLLGGRIGDYMGRKKIFLIGLIGFAAAVTNAVFNATGKRVRDLPITPAKLGFKAKA